MEERGTDASYALEIGKVDFGRNERTWRKAVACHSTLLRCYIDSDMEVRPLQQPDNDAVAISHIPRYPNMRMLPQLRRNGFKGDFHGIPETSFQSLDFRTRIETC